ncbi:hypothetical protein ACF07S_10875 [Streptomyces sp. NPDC016640]|uniref:hypothetical protein n=1 Tax=Streptomyces sp. NPDC016640 TaxID=3364969 RepID=UPI003702307A
MCDHEEGVERGGKRFGLIRNGASTRRRPLRGNDGAALRRGTLAVRAVTAR